MQVSQIIASAQQCPRAVPQYFYILQQSANWGFVTLIGSLAIGNMLSLAAALPDQDHLTSTQTPSTSYRLSGLPQEHSSANIIVVNITICAVLQWAEVSAKFSVNH